MKNIGGLYKKENWEEMAEWLADSMQKFYSVFKPGLDEIMNTKG